MAVLPIVYNGAQLGVQTVLGTGVAANKLLQSLGFSRLNPQSAGGRMFRPQGQKLNTLSVPPGKQWSDISYEGEMTFNEMAYPLSSSIKKPTVGTDGTNGKVWEFSNAKSSVDTRAIYTYENGNGTRAKKAIDMHFLGFQLEMSREASRITGSARAGKRQDDVTITASPTEINPKIIAPQKFDVYLADAQADLDAASVFPLPMRAVFTYPDAVAALYRMNSTDPHFHALVEGVLEGITLELMVGDDDADYGTLLALIDSGATKFIRIKALGDAIAGATPSQEEFELDFAGKLIEPEDPAEEEGAALNTFVFQNVYDSTWGRSFNLKLINALAAL